MSDYCKPEDDEMLDRHFIGDLRPEAGYRAASCSEPSCQYYSVPPISPESIAATLDLIEDAILSDQWRPEAKARLQEMADHLGAIPQNVEDNHK